MVRIRDKAHLPSTFARMGPAREIQLLTKSGVTPLQVSRFAADNAHANLSHQARGSLHGFAAFCELIKVRPFSPQEETTLRWISVFNDTATLGSYMALLAKACFSPRFSTTWLTHAVRHVARGLQKCQDRSFRFPNFIRIRLVAKISARESHRIEFAQARFFSFMFSFRIPSATLQLRRSFSTDHVEGFAPQLEKALIGVRTIDGQQSLSVMLTTRKNHAPGCILRRPCFCHLDAPKALKMCPVHVFWAEVRRCVLPGQLPFQSVTRRNFNRALKAVLARLGAPAAER